MRAPGSFVEVGEDWRQAGRQAGLGPGARAGHGRVWQKGDAEL